MSAPFHDLIYQQIRNVSEDELDKLCSVISENFYNSEKQGECMGAMRQIFLILQASDTTGTRFPKRTLAMLLQSLSSPTDKVSVKQCTLCHDILKQLAASNQLDMEQITGEEARVNANHLSIALSQSQNLSCLEKLLVTAVRWLTSQSLDFDELKKTFSFLLAVAAVHRPLLKAGDVSSVSETVSDWLMSASLYQGNNPHALNPFRRDQATMVTEIDGTPCHNFFSVLNIGQYYTNDQLLNIFTFSLLYKWLYYTSHGDECLSDESFTSTTSSSSPHLSPIMSKVHNVLVSKAIEYCFRIMDQCERKPKTTADADLQNACMLESLCVLDHVCKLDQSHVPRIFQEVKRLYSHISQDASHTRSILAVLQFFINHSADVVYDPQPAYDHYFGQVLAKNYSKHGVAFDTVMFLRDNLHAVCFKTNILSKYFPNIMKILAWNPRTFVTEYLDLIPAFMSSSTAIEVFHLILDLPCTAAALDVSKRVSKVENAPSQVTTSTPSSSVEAYNNPLYHPMFKFMLRIEGGHGDTINRLNVLHSVLEDLNGQARVIVCSQIVPVLLRYYFTVVLEDGDSALAKHLLPVMLERIGLLYNVPEYKADVRKILSEAVYMMFRTHPHLVGEEHEEIMEYFGSTRNITDKEEFFSHLVWSVGEYCSPAVAVQCTSEVITHYYEALEVLTYEVSGLVQVCSEDKAPFTPKLICMFMSALAKLATRCQDLIPRVILCLTKVLQQQGQGHLDSESREAITERAQELINLLKLPNFASSMLNPSSEVETGRWHTDNHSQSAILRATHKILTTTAIQRHS